MSTDSDKLQAMAFHGSFLWHYISFWINNIKGWSLPPGLPWEDSWVSDCISLPLALLPRWGERMKRVNSIFPKILTSELIFRSFTLLKLFLCNDVDMKVWVIWKNLWSSTKWPGYYFRSAGIQEVAPQSLNWLFKTCWFIAEEEGGKEGGRQKEGERERERRWRQRGKGRTGKKISHSLVCSLKYLL